MNKGIDYSIRYTDMLHSNCFDKQNLNLIPFNAEMIKSYQ